MAFTVFHLAGMRFHGENTEMTEGCEACTSATKHGPRTVLEGCHLALVKLVMMVLGHVLRVPSCFSTNRYSPRRGLRIPKENKEE